MTKTIITQNGDIINLNSLFAIYVDTAINSSTNKKHYEQRAEGFMRHSFVIGTYADHLAAARRLRTGEIFQSSKRKSFAAMR